MYHRITTDQCLFESTIKPLAYLSYLLCYKIDVTEAALCRFCYIILTLFNECACQQCVRDFITISTVLYGIEA